MARWLSGRCRKNGTSSSSSVLLAISGIYIAQGAIGGLTFIGVPAIMRSQGASLETIGLVSLFMLPWALKFLWAAPVERFRQRRDGSRRSKLIVALSQLAILGALISILIGAGSDACLLVALAIATIAAATADIACDAYAVERLEGVQRGWGNAAQVGGAYAGTILGGGIFLMAVSAFGIEISLMGLVFLIAISTLPFALTREPRVAAKAVVNVPSLRLGFARKEIWRAIAIVLVFGAAMRFVQAMLPPLLVDLGFSLETVGAASGAGGLIVGLIGVLACGATIRRFGQRRSLVAAAMLQAFSITLIASVYIANLDSARSLMLPSVLFFYGSVGFGFVALYTVMMDISGANQPGIDFTILQCADALIAAFAGYIAGQVAGILGYMVFFTIAAVFSIAMATGLTTVTFISSQMKSGEKLPR